MPPPSAFPTRPEDGVDPLSLVATPPPSAFPTRPEDGVDPLSLVAMIDPRAPKLFPKLPKVEDLVARHDHRPVSYHTSKCSL